ncbi:hypothetical protein AC578_4439 [Pseudocercospora eumusae]|uniref:Uncharacterized protein n=1 Tax=Pseudocercospora eumusae TaxID=321146 RepID=A0A139HF09_9PEZI|nr:hypothetical protein AC578_4439 [Pseudocercospora eumusae]KXT01041.1 hypothetical protein AC578_4439 [Pseudocercospora eumusae]
MLTRWSVVEVRSPQPPCLPTTAISDAALRIKFLLQPNLFVSIQDQIRATAALASNEGSFRPLLSYTTDTLIFSLDQWTGRFARVDGGAFLQYAVARKDPGLACGSVKCLLSSANSQYMMNEHTASPDFNMADEDQPASTPFTDTLHEFDTFDYDQQILKLHETTNDFQCEIIDLIGKLDSGDYELATVERHITMMSSAMIRVAELQRRITQTCFDKYEQQAQETERLEAMTTKLDKLKAKLSKRDEKQKTMKADLERQQTDLKHAQRKLSEDQESLKQAQQAFEEEKQRISNEKLDIQICQADIDNENHRLADWEESLEGRETAVAAKTKNNEDWLRSMLQIPDKMTLLDGLSNLNIRANTNEELKNQLEESEARVARQDKTIELQDQKIRAMDTSLDNLNKLVKQKDSIIKQNAQQRLRSGSDPGISSPSRHSRMFSIQTFPTMELLTTPQTNQLRRLPHGEPPAQLVRRGSGVDFAGSNGHGR